MSPRQLFKRGEEHLAYLQTYAPQLPAEDATTIQEEFRRLENVVKLASDYVKTEDARRFLGFCLSDLDQSLAAYEANEKDLGLERLNSAHHWFVEARKDTKSRPTFIVGPDGQARRPDPEDSSH